MNKRVLKIHPKDNVIVALQDLSKGETIYYLDERYQLIYDVPAKHKFVTQDLNEGDQVIMYGVIVGTARKPIHQGAPITTENVIHKTDQNVQKEGGYRWEKPVIEKWKDRTFMGYHRKDGTVGTANYWIVAPLVFCENRNIEVIRDSMLHQLGYSDTKSEALDIGPLIHAYLEGANNETIENTVLQKSTLGKDNRVFPNIDGIKFLSHHLGCGGTRKDAAMLCELIAGYITNPNVAGATILSLGCQNAEDQLLRQAIRKRDPDSYKPVYFFEQQQSSNEEEFIAEAIKATFIGLIGANKLTRTPAPLSKLIIGLECGGSDGFSGISANPALGYASDLINALGGATILSEFPELNGIERELINRCVDDSKAKRFLELMTAYEKRAKQAGSGFEANPSPGNIKDGLITDAIKSAGAAKKGGTAPVADVLDYAEPVKNKGLNLLCTPGNDVESTTALAGSGANIIVFTTGLGTPTGNPVSPVVKVSSNTTLFNKMNDIIDIDAGPVISGEKSIEDIGEDILKLIINVASGEKLTKAQLLHQDDFIPWKRDVSL